MDEQYAIRKAELNHTQRLQRVLKDTLTMYRSACAYIGEVVFSHWKELSVLTNEQKLTQVEVMIHKTKKNPSPVYTDFDRLYYKFPSYLRRSAVHYAIGQVSSYMTRLDDYNDKKHEAMSGGRRFRNKPPRLTFEASAFPTLYKEQSYQLDGKKIRIKAYIRNTWDWVEVGIPTRDLKSLKKADNDPTLGKRRSPQLVYAYHKFYLHFPYKAIAGRFPKVPLDERVVLGVDLGINHGAVCSAVDSCGHVYSRAFDPFRAKRKKIDRILKAIRDIQRKSGPQSLSRLYTKLSGVKDDYAKQLARWIVDLAASLHVYGIVLEHLGRMKWKRGHKDRLHHWCKKRIAKYIKGMAMRLGIRVFIINPKNTSALAFDGSGAVVRDKSDFSKCTFATGKRYDCDLSASYNIAARYFLREMEKATPSETWEVARAEVPELPKRTQCTLSTLWKLAHLSAKKAA